MLSNNPGPTSSTAWPINLNLLSIGFSLNNLKIFSTTTIAASTKIPRESIRANNVILLIVCPLRFPTPKTTESVRGIEIKTITALCHPKNNSKIIATITIAWIKLVVSVIVASEATFPSSLTTVVFTSAGITFIFLSSSILARSELVIFVALVPLSFEIAI